MSPTARWTVAVALVAFLAAMAGIGARATYGAQTSADEPYYLLTAHSLAEDGDLDISDDLEAEAFRPFHEILLDPQTTPLQDGRRVSPHDPLLSVLLAPAMALPDGVGWVAAKVTLALVAAVLAGLTTWVAIRRFAVRPAVAAVVVGGLSAAMPLASYGTQVYPEVPAALAAMSVVAVVTAPTLRRSHLLVAVLGIVALPWLSVKYVPVAGVLAVLAGVRAWRGGHRRAVVTATAALGVAGIAYLAAHQAWYGGWTVYAAGDHFVEAGEASVMGVDPDHLGRSRRLFGLLVDRGYGLSAWTPAWLALPAAVGVVVARRVPHRWTLLGPAAAGWATATWIALTMHGWWSPGRQVVVVLPLLVVVVAVAVDRLWPSRAWRIAGIVLLATGVVNWLWLAVEATTGGPVLIVDFAETAAPVHRVVASVLPDGIAGGVANDLGLLAWAAVLALTTLACRLTTVPGDLSRHATGGGSPPIPPACRETSVEDHVSRHAHDEVVEA